ncbi:hypothetical protein TNCV_1957611 [Trichonephila clavipes]|nr:hypothetical protein TNCV_1957611 [Trichonephila clavipes]
MLHLYFGTWDTGVTQTKTPSLEYADTLQDATNRWSSGDSGHTDLKLEVMVAEWSRLQIHVLHCRIAGLKISDTKETHRVERPMHTKSVEVLSRPVCIEWKFRGGKMRV